MLIIIVGNQITVIKGIKGLVSLTHLSIADNRLERIESLDHLPLKYLNLVCYNSHTLSHTMVVYIEAHACHMKNVQQRVGI